MISLFVSNSDSRYTSNNGSTVTLPLNPPIILDPSKRYYACATEIDVVYCFANIFTGKNDKFKYTEMKNGTPFAFEHTISQGIYTWRALQDEINRCTQADVQNNALFILEPDTSTSHMFIHFMTTTCKINCFGSDNMMKILGYPESTAMLGPVTYKNDFYEGDNAQLNNIQNVLLTASFVSGGYKNSQATNILASITPDVEPYSTILYRPNKSIYVPVSQNVLDTMSFQLTDQDGNILNLGVHDASDPPERWSARIIIVDEDHAT